MVNKNCILSLSSQNPENGYYYEYPYEYFEKESEEVSSVNPDVATGTVTEDGEVCMFWDAYSSVSATFASRFLSLSRYCLNAFVCLFQVEAAAPDGGQEIPLTVREVPGEATGTEEHTTDIGDYGTEDSYVYYEEHMSTPEPSRRITISSSVDHGMTTDTEVDLGLGSRINLGFGGELEKKVVTGDGHTTVTIKQNNTHVSPNLSSSA